MDDDEYVYDEPVDGKTTDVHDAVYGHALV
jgi:hypothetical protein